MTDETRQLAHFAAEFTYGHIPAQVRARAIDILVDQIGVEIGCSELPWARQVHATYRAVGGVPEATIVRYGEKLPAGSAAFINSTFGHSFEYDDGNPKFHGHAGAELIPPLLAVAEREHVTGRDFLTAFVAAYEVRGHIGWALSPEMARHGGPQYSTACGPFGVSVGVAKLLGLKAEGIRNAMGIAGGYAGGLMQYDHGGGSVKRIYTAIAANAGMQAAQLARAGITGPEGILEGARGLLRIYSPAYKPERLVSGLGSAWMFETAYFKPYCCVGIIAAAIDGFRNIVAGNNLAEHDIESVEVGYPKGYDLHAGITDPHDILGMQFSTAYSLALTLLKGGNTPREYTQESLNDPQIRAFAARVRVFEDAELTAKYEGRLPARVLVNRRSGGTIEELVINARGSPGAPLSSGEIDAKMRSQVAAILGHEKCENLLRTLRGIDTLDDMARLPPMLVAH